MRLPFDGEHQVSGPVPDEFRRRLIAAVIYYDDLEGWSFGLLRQGSQALIQRGPVVVDGDDYTELRSCIGSVVDHASSRYRAED
jgi:hypothetical protein